MNGSERIERRSPESLQQQGHDLYGGDEHHHHIAIYHEGLPSNNQLQYHYTVKNDLTTTKAKELYQ